MSRSALLIPSSAHCMPATAPPQQHHQRHYMPPRHYPPSPQSTSAPPPSAHSMPARRLSILDTAWPYNIQHHHQNRLSPPPSTPRHVSSPALPPSKEHHHPTDKETPAFFNLEKVVQQYGEQPELLGLILSSKVEEDRRRAEEAKLKQKEIDYLLQQHQGDVDNHQPGSRYSRASWRSVAAAAVAAFGSNNNTSNSSISSISSSISSSSSRSIHNASNSPPENKKQLKPFSAVTESRWEGSSLDDGMALGILPRIQSPPRIRRGSAGGPNAGWRRPSSDPYPRPQHSPRTPAVMDQQRRRSIKNIDMLLSHSPRTERSSLPPISISPISDNTRKHHDSESSHPPPSTTSSSSSLLDSEGDPEMTMSVPAAARHYPHQQRIPTIDRDFPNRPPFPMDKLPIPPVRAQLRQQRPSARRRRRREVQAISTIIETREFPYNDDYLWKNNGNTVHKKTGHRSIYYKCSNSAKGCPVNKTVTFKEHGEYLIKYRGQHLDECNRIKRIVDV